MTIYQYKHYYHQYRGITVVVVHDSLHDCWWSELIYGSPIDPQHQEVEETFETRLEAQREAHRVIDEEISREIDWERKAGLYEEKS